MSNRIRLKKYLIGTLIAGVLILLCFLALNLWEYHSYTLNFNQKLDAIVSAITEKYPDVTETELMEILNSENTESPSILARYGINIKDTSAITENESTFYLFLILTSLLVILAAAALVFLHIRYDKGRSRDIAQITRTIEQINQRNYDLDLDAISEDELSILKNEIYKTTVMLREAADNSAADRQNLKKSLEDISHQLKTPLTSILVMLDNIIDDPEMEPDVRNEFIRSIRRDTVNINFFIQAILKLSRFDSNTIQFIREETDLRDVISDSMQNVSVLCDLRDITPEYTCEEPAEIVCDRKWQTEAVTNILKNCIDHSHDGSSVQITLSQNSVYSMIEITDHGDGISKKDLPHIFERFYKGENAVSDSIGIGLALARSIIEEDNGTVSADSDSSGTRFRIKYYTL